MSSQSPEFSESVRDTAQTISVNDSDNVRNANFDALDDFIQRGDMGGAKDYIKQMALSHATADQQNQFYGKERTIEFLGEIKDDLSALEKSGFSTNFFTGNWENLVAKVGQVKNPEMRKVATKIATAVMQYRRSMTGVQFGMIENKEYKRIFPNINKINVFNSASINALQESFRGDLDNFYSLKMGRKNYEKIFGKSEKSVLKESATPQGKYQEGQTATNPKTGKQLIFRGGKWQTQ